MIHTDCLRALLLIAAAGLGVSACSSQPDIDPRELRLTETAILEAKQLGSERFARQAQREAEERFRLARDLIDEGREDEALRMLSEARVLAMRAEAESLAQQAVNASEVVQESLNTLENALGAGPDAQ